VICRIASLLLLAAAGMAADVLVMRDGLEIRCRVIHQDSRQVVIECEGHRVTFDAVLVSAVRHDERELAPSPPTTTPHRPPAYPARLMAGYPTPWSVTVGLGAPWMMGSVDGTGTLLDRGTGASSPLVSTFDLDGPGLPCVWSRLAWEPQAPEPSPLLGLRVAYGATSGSAGHYTQGSLSVAGGWSVPLEGCRVVLLADAGLTRAEVERSLALPRGEPVDDSSALTGWTAGLGISATWSTSWGVSLSADVGLHHARLTGDATWSSAAYSGTESLSACVTSVQVGLGVAWHL